MDVDKTPLDVKEEGGDLPFVNLEGSDLVGQGVAGIRSR